MELLLFSLVLGAALFPMMFGAHPYRGRIRGVALAIATLAIAGAVFLNPHDRVPPDRHLPGTVKDENFVTSNACRPCHPAQYATWHATYHRTMTEIATPATVLAPFDGIQLEQKGRIYRLERRGDEFWVDMVDPAWELSQTLPGFDPNSLFNPPRVRQPIVMTTGSHHLQVYWVAAAHGNGMFFQVPGVYQIDEKRWISASDSFLRPVSEGPVEIEVWNTTCIDCHSVGGQPQMVPSAGTMYSRVAELGVACETCHRPAADHVGANRNPLRRYLFHLRGVPDPTIVNPAHPSPVVSAQICGQCHSVTGPSDPTDWMLHGRRYRSGDDLTATRRIVRYTEHPQEPWMLEWLKQNPDELRGRFWADGTVRVAGREYNGLIESACYQKGGLSCVSCHSMHRSDPNDQLAAGMDGDQACSPCHTKYRNNVQEHTHHRRDSSGSLCYNCHMPHTTYGLFVAMRSHRIDSPSVVTAVQTGRPNACNLCHLDQTLAWTADYLVKWYGSPAARLSEDEKQVAASLLWLLRGDAAQRAITAWSMGWEPARQTAGDRWIAPFLGLLLDDPYSSVRHAAFQSLRRLPGFNSLKYDFISPRNQRLQSMKQVLELWGRHRSEPKGKDRSAILIDSEGLVRQEWVDRLMKQRDDRAIRIIE